MVLYNVLSGNQNDSCTVSGSYNRSNIFVLEDLGDADIQMGGMKIWKHDGGLIHSFAGVCDFEHEDLTHANQSAVATQLVISGAFPKAAPLHWWRVVDGHRVDSLRHLAPPGFGLAAPSAGPCAA